ncbi:hypothetical protein EDD17DRAFT_1511099 [Pisolithus thermaeus]|nr:hypothetical protein EDD17DRAFT_1511099 [Pisolithus thermaeus]
MVGLEDGPWDVWTRWWQNGGKGNSGTWGALVNSEMAREDSLDSIGTLRFSLCDAKRTVVSKVKFGIYQICHMSRVGMHAATTEVGKMSKSRKQGTHEGAKVGGNGVGGDRGSSSHATMRKQGCLMIVIGEISGSLDSLHHAQSTNMYGTKVSSGLEAKNDSDEGGNRKTRKQQPTSGEESEAANERKSRQRKKQKGTTGEEIPAATWGSTVASVQKVSKSTVGARSQVATGSNATEPIVAHTGSNPKAAMTVDNNTMGVDNDLDEANPGKIMSKTKWRVTRIKSNAMKAPDVNAMGKEVEGVTTRMVVDNEGRGYVECARPSMVSQLNGKGNSLHEPVSHSPRSPFPVIGLVPNWHSTKVHLAVPPQSQPNTKTSNSKARSQHRMDGSASNPNAVPQDGYKSLYGGLNDGDDANDTCTQVLYTNAFHLTPNGKPTLPLICLKKPGSILPGCVNMESECGYLTIDKHRVGSGEEGHDYDGYRGNNMGSNWDEHSNNNNNNNNGSSNNGDAPAPTCTTSCVVEQSGLDARAFKKGSSNSFKPVVRVFNHSLTCKVPSMEQPSQQVQEPGPSQNQPSGAPSCMQGHSCHAVEADEENFETLFHDIVLPCWIFYFSLLNSPWKLANPLHVAHVQKLWAETFPNIKCTVALHNDPIFALIHPLAFYLVTILIISEVKQSYVAWAVPEVTEIIDAHGHVKPVAPSLFPYMWERVEEGPDSPIPKGAVGSGSSLLRE